ncbi:MAG TPA: hypothetical protein VGF56_09800 [Rhizomicrobium sp.]|jgi:hypothetical protein
MAGFVFNGGTIGRVLIGLFLILAFTATGAVLLFVITAEQLQSSIAAPDIAQFKPTIGSIRQYVAEIERYYAIANSAEDKQTATQRKLFDESVTAQGALAQMTTASDGVRAFINQNNSRYVHWPLQSQPFLAQSRQAAAPQPAPASGSETAPPSTQPAPPEQMSKAPPNVLSFPDELATYFSKYDLAYAAIATTSNGELKSQLEEFKAQTFKRMQPYIDARASYDAAQSRIQSFNAQIAALDSQENGYYAEITDPKYPLHDDAYWNLCEDFYSFKSLVGDWAYNIVLFPKMMLVLILAIFMGILGSLIAISQDYLKDPAKRGFWDILFRIGLGAGVAFALFFFAAAGMLALSQNSSGSQADMSPYLISFLGITGGYLSDRVTAWMREVGENTFKIAAGGPPDRWAVGLAAALTAENLDATVLASATGVTAADAGDWVSLAKPVPGDKQALVSAFLRLHPSKLFTDIAPG